MGFYRLIHRIGRMVFRDFLFKIPKKYLVVIIIFLSLFILKSNVFAQSLFLPNKFSDSFIDNVKAMSEYQSGNYYCFVGGGYASGNNNQFRIYYVPKTYTGKFYFQSDIGTGYMIRLQSSASIIIYETNNTATYFGQPSTETKSNCYFLVGVNDPEKYKQFYGTADVYTNNSFTDYFYSSFVAPFVTTDSSSIVNWSMSSLDISSGNLKNSNEYGQNYFYLEQIYNGVIYRIDLNNSSYKTINAVTNTCTFSIPRQQLLSGAYIASTYTYELRLVFQEAQEGGSTFTDYNLGSYVLDLTTQEEQITNDGKMLEGLEDISNAQQETTNAINNMNENITNSQQETTNSINNLNNNITNDNVSSSVIQQPDMPNDTTGVENGVNNIFNVIMNAFTNFDSSQEVVLPIPFTDKSITISGNYTRDMLTSVNAAWVINFISIFWWYIISVYIIKDILKTVDKIQEGKIDSVENSNIKGDML